MAFSNPLRLEVQKRLSAALEEITPGNGYVFDFSPSPTRRVFRGRTAFGDGDPLPMLSILEVPIPLDQLPPPTPSTSSSGGWELMIQGFAEDDRDDPTDPAHVMLADVKKRLAIEKRKIDWNRPEEGPFGLGRVVTNILMGPGVVRPPDELSAKAYFWLTVQLDLVEDLDDPYGVDL